MIKSVLPLSLIIALRFLGLFIVLPILSVYALSLEGANELLVGIIIGGYALTQMIFQVPFGALSDKIGRKKTIIFGLIIFALGSIVCAISSDIYMLMIGRFLQGAGAIGAVVTAMISDVVKEEQRAKAMAMMGGSIAASFALSMALGPVIGGLWGAGTLFWITAVLSLLAIGILITKVPPVPVIYHDVSEEDKRLSNIFKDANLIRMNITNFLQKGMMTLAFLIIPIILTSSYGFEKSELYKVYLPAMIFGVLAMPFSAIIGEKKHKAKEMLLLGIILFGIAYALMGVATSSLVFILGVVVFFIGFNIHEPLLQSLTSKYAKVHQKGTALGVFNSFGYFGTFIGGVVGGAMLQSYSMGTIGIIVAILCLAWIALLFAMPNPSLVKNLYIKINENTKERTQSLKELSGIKEWYINESEQVLVVKYDTQKIEAKAIEEHLAQ
jgi:predicted MFS family arabinose efflux permease